MRKALMLCTVLTLVLAVAGQATAFGWRGLLRGTHHTPCHSHAVVIPQAHAPASVATTAPVDQPDSSADAQMDESVALRQVIAAVKEMLLREDARLQRELNSFEEDEYDSSSYGTD